MPTNRTRAFTTVEALATRKAFTLTDLLALLALATVLGATVITGAAHARSLRGAVTSADNLRTLGAAHATYTADWNGRQLTFVDDRLSTYGNSICTVFDGYEDEHDVLHRAMELGWGRVPGENFFYYRYRLSRGQCANASLTVPIMLDGPNNLVGFGSFRLFNVQQFAMYGNGRFYDPVYYAPEDTAVLDSIDAGGCFDVPGQYCTEADVSQHNGDTPAWSSYCLSPAGLYHPRVFAHDDPDDPDFNGYEDPFSFDEGCEAPSLSQALYPDLKTWTLEHHWLQNNPGRDCNPGFENGTYGGCEPYYFNHALVSSPVTLFYDGHVAEFVIVDAIEDDALVRFQNENDNWGLWSQDTPLGANGYRSEFAWDNARTSVHVFTTDGIRGRDVLGPGASRPPRPAVATPRRDRGIPFPRPAPDDPRERARLSLTE